LATSYSYNDASNLAAKINPNLTSVSFIYEGLTCVQTKVLSNGGTWTYSYDKAASSKDRLASVSRGSEGTTYNGYNAASRPQAVSTSGYNAPLTTTVCVPC
jgi:hypothetical protein